MMMERCRWQQSAALALAPITEDMDALRAGVEAGRCELWRIDGASWVVTQVVGNVLWVHCYAGRNLCAFASRLYRIAQRNGCRRIVFEAPKPHTLKLLLSYWNPREVEPGLWEIAVHPLYVLH